MASANLLLDKSRKKDGKHPVCIRICYLRKQWAVTTKISASLKDYEKALSDKGTLNDKQKQLRSEMLEQRTKAQNILDSLDVITKDTFKRAYFSEFNIVKANDMIRLKHCFEVHIEQLKEEGRINTAEVFKHTLRTMLLYKGDKYMQEIDASYLRGYESWMERNGCSMSTTSIYLRSLKRIFNKLIKDKKLSAKYYPFEEHVCRSSRAAKTVLYPKDVEKFFNHEPLTPAGKEAKAYWFFSFLCNGMNPRDIFDLKRKHVQGDRMTYMRHKTAKRKTDPIPIIIYLHPYVLDLIKTYGQKKGDYVFPLFEGLETEQDRYKALHDWKRHTNRCLNRMAKTLDVPQLNMGIARHSMATSLAMKNIHVSVISKMLGHSKLQTTEHYLYGLPDEAMREINHGMLDFSKARLKAV